MKGLRLIARDDGRPPWVWYQRLDRRNGRLEWGPVGKPFNRRRVGHWLVVVCCLWREGKRP